jgi:hypothetical protein
MTHIDFMIGFILIISTIFMIMYFVSSSISNNMNDVYASGIKESALTLENYLFKVGGENSLAVSARVIQAVLEDVNGTDHGEYSTILIRPQVINARVYDEFWNDIPSSQISLPGETSLSFTLNFVSNEKKSMNIVYLGDSVESLSYSDSDGMTSMRALPGKEIMIVTQERCSYLQGISYDDFRDSLDFDHQFRLELGNCAYGSETPSAANILVRSVPVIFEGQDGSVSDEYARLMVW